jgi:hypothetical protein
MIDAVFARQESSNPCATAEPRPAQRARIRLLLCLLVVAPCIADNDALAQQQEPPPRVNRVAAVGGFVGGMVVGLLAHEGGHLLFDVIFDADPGIKRVEFQGIPFFAITHRPDLSPRQEFTISSAGFWVQNATNEWLLTRRPRLREEHAPFAKGVFAFNVGTSAMYSVAAFAEAGPPERDTRGMADSSGLDEAWIGAIVLAPAVFDTWRYFDPDSRWAVWFSRAAKIGSVLLVLR